MGTTWLQVLHATSKIRAVNSLPCGTDMGYLRQHGSPYQPLYSLMGLSTASLVPTSLRTTRESYQPVHEILSQRKKKN